MGKKIVADDLAVLHDESDALELTNISDGISGHNPGSKVAVPGSTIFAPAGALSPQLNGRNRPDKPQNERYGELSHAITLPGDELKRLRRRDSLFVLLLHSTEILLHYPYKSIGALRGRE